MSIVALAKNFEEAEKACDAANAAMEEYLHRAEFLALRETQRQAHEKYRDAKEALQCEVSR
jgi:hypothetical protein